MQSLKYCMLAFLISLALIGDAHGQELRFDRFTLEQGLSNMVIRDIHQDRYGIMWFATEHGLNRYDGYEFKVFRYHPYDSLSMAANWIDQIEEDQEGNIWLRLSIGGVCKFDRGRQEFHYFTYDRATPNTTNNYCRELYCDALGRVWVGTWEGLNLVSDTGSTFLPLPYLDDKGEELSEGIPVETVIMDRWNQLWVGTREGLYVLNPEEGALVPATFTGEKGPERIEGNVSKLYEDRKGRLWVATFQQGMFMAQSGAKNFVKVPMEGNAEATLWGIVFAMDLVEDPSGRIWASFWEEGLYELDEKKLRFTRVLPERDSALFIRDLMPDSSGYIWGVNHDYRLLRFNPRNNSLDRIRPEKEREGLPGSTTFGPIYTSREGNIWLGSSGSGIYKISRGRQKFSLYDSWGKQEDFNNYVSALCEDSEGYIWIGTGGGLYRQDRLTGKFRLYRREYKNENSLGSNVIRALAQDSEGNLWIGHDRGVDVLDPARRRFRHYFKDPNNKGALSSSIIQGIYEDRQGDMWICTSNGLHLYDKENDSFVRYLHDPDNINSLNSSSVRVVYQEEDGTYWVGNIVGMLSKMRRIPRSPEPDSLVFEHFLFRGENNPELKVMTINTLHIGRDNRIWVGTFSNGLLEYNREENRLVSVMDPERPPIPNIAGILEDSKGGLWISSCDGLYFFDPVRNTFRHYDTNDGLQSRQFRIGAYLKTRDEKMYFGGINGFNAFEPGDIRPNPDVPAPILTSFFKMGEEVRFDKPLAEVPSVDLRYNENYIRIGFVSPDYNNPERNTYAYKLEGMDADWITAGTRRVASYTNLPPGDYLFRVRTSNSDGRWNPEEARLSLSISPPFWQTLWFYILIGLLLAGAILLAFRLRVRAKLKKIREIEAIRQKAAADFHDELGHRLTRISLLAEVMDRKYNGEAEGIREYLGKIKENSRGLNSSMRDFLWALDPKKDSVYELAILLKDFGDDLFDNSQIGFSIGSIGPELKNLHLNMDWKRHLVLIFKEAMHNSLKHAGCENVSLKVGLHDEELRLELSDDGVGFVPDARSEGYGIRNMKNRAKLLKGQLEISSNEQTGSLIRFRGKPED